MFNKLYVVVARSYCLLLLLLVLTSSTSGNPLSRGDGSESKKVVDFNIHVTESGEEYNETIEVDTQKQTEVFKVPAHPGVDRSDVMHDFKQKLTMMRIPEKGICYLMPLPKELSAPDKLIGDLEKASQGVIDKGTRIDSTWMVNGELTERSFLSDDLQQFCTDFPIYLLKESRNSLAVIGIQEAEIANRLRRQAIPDVGKICDGGMDYNTALRFCDKPYRKCKVATRTCYKWVTCPGGGRSEAPPSSLMAVNSFVVEVRSNGCLERHVYANVSCCKYECP